MLFQKLFQSVLLFTLASLTSAAYSADGHNVAVYWGQGSGQKSLGTYCESGDMDIVVVSFVNNFQGSTVSFNFGSACSGQTCPTIASDIKKCQSKGVKVLLSLGGAVGSYGISSDGDAKEVANQLYKLFGPSGSVFPGAQIDGVDLDIEAGSHTGYTPFVSAVKSKFGSKFLVSAAPQCVYPDAYIGDALKNAQIDMAFIQFYNNPCALDKTFNWDTWAKANFANKNMKLYIGLPGSSAAAGSGYVSPDTVKKDTASALSSSKFGGFMVWDAVTGTNNVVGGKSFIANLKAILGGSKGSPSSSGSPATSAKNTPSATVTKHSHSKASTIAPASVAASGAPKVVTAEAVTLTTTKHVPGAGSGVADTTTLAPKNAANSVGGAPTTLATVATSLANDAFNVPSINNNVLWAATSSEPLNTNVLWAATSSIPLNTDVMWAVTSKAAPAANTVAA